MKKIILIISIIFLTGCNYHELDQLGIVSSIYIDYNENYKIQLEMIKNDNTIILENSGSSISEALDNIQNKCEYYLFYSHLNSVFITPTVNLNDVMESLMRDVKTNDTFYLIITKDTLYNEEEDIGSKYNRILSKFNYNNFFETYKTYKDDNKDLIIIDDELNYYIYNNKNTIINKLDSNNSKIYNLFKNNEIIFNIPYKNGHIIIKTNNANINIKIENKIIINIELETSIQEFTSTFKYADNDEENLLEKYVNDYIKNEVNTFINTLIENDSDILGIDNKIINKNHNYYLNFKDYDYEININTHINKKGLIRK